MFKTSQKGFAPIILLFVVTLIAVAAGAYFYGKGGLKLPTKQPASSGARVSTTPTPDETANWKTYTDTELGIGFKYPDTWEVRTEIEASSNAGLVFLEVPQEKKTGISYAAFIEYVDNPKNLSIKEYQEQLNKEGAAPIYYSENSSPVKIAGIDGFYEKNSDCSPGSCDRYTFPYKGKIWGVNLMEMGLGKYMKEKEKILSTFRFN